MNRHLLLILVIVSLTSAFNAKEDLQPARNLFRRLTGVPLLNSDPRLFQMKDLMAAGKAKEAAEIATDDRNFLETRVRHWAAALSNKAESPDVPFNDFQALFVGVVRDELDGRLVLSGNFRYEGTDSKLPPISRANNDHYQALEASGADWRTDLRRVEPQWDPTIEGSGVLTTRGWGEAHFNGGTNRRAVQYTFQEFLCRPLPVWKSPGLPDFRVRRDVSRAPGGSTEVYQTECRTCHAGMDALGGAFARFDFTAATLFYISDRVTKKMNQNAVTFPDGFVTTDDGWLNLSTQGHNQNIGWRGALSGYGIQAFGEMISNARGFSECMVQQIFFQVCRREITSAAKDALVADFEKGGYRFRRLFEKVALHPECEPQE